MGVGVDHPVPPPDPVAGVGGADAAGDVPDLQRVDDAARLVQKRVERTAAGVETGRILRRGREQFRPAFAILREALLQFLRAFVPETEQEETFAGLHILRVIVFAEQVRRFAEPHRPAARHAEFGDRALHLRHIPVAALGKRQVARLLFAPYCFIGVTVGDPPVRAVQPLPVPGRLVGPGASVGVDQFKFERVSAGSGGEFQPEDQRVVGQETFVFQRHPLQFAATSVAGRVDRRIVKFQRVAPHSVEPHHRPEEQRPRRNRVGLKETGVPEPLRAVIADRGQAAVAGEIGGEAPAGEGDAVGADAVFEKGMSAAPVHRGSPR